MTYLRLTSAVLLISISALPSGVAQRTKPASKTDPYLKAFPVITRPVLGKDTNYTSFVLRTSWIPGEEHRGSFRYQVFAYGINLNDEEKPAYIEKLFKCDFTLELYDDGGFVLRRIDVPFRRAISPQGVLSELDANDAKQMELADYRKLLNGGSYEVAWTCPK